MENEYKDRYKVIEFWPDLGIKLRIIPYDKKDEAFQHCGQLKYFVEAPYLLIGPNGKILDIETFDLTREQMAEMLEEFG